MRRSKLKPATHPWRKAGDMENIPSDQHGVFVRTLTATEYQCFRETNELPKVGSISHNGWRLRAFVVAPRPEMLDYGEIPADRSERAADRE